MLDSTRRTIRTVFQGVVSLAAAAPLLVAATGLPEKTAGIGVFVAVSAAVTRLMALPVVEALMPSWLRKYPPQ